jgi:hypothetical protein
MERPPPTSLERTERERSKRGKSVGNVSICLELTREQRYLMR